MRALIALLLSLWLAPAWAQVPLTGAGKGTPAAFAGPFDVYTTAPAVGWSCARALSAAKAAAQANLCELVDSASPTTPICTLKAKKDGFVDLTTASCTGGLTPAAACAAATGGVCNIWKIYDQSGNSRDAVQATAANQPVIRFSSTPSGALPAIDCKTAGTIIASVSAGTAINQAFATSLVAFHPTGLGNGNLLGSDGTAVTTISSTTATVAAGTNLTAAISDNTWYAVQGLLNGNGTSSAINVNGSDTTGAAGTGGIASGATLSICRALGSQGRGYIAEALIWGSSATTTSTDRTNIYNNQHSANGYGTGW